MRMNRLLGVLVAPVLLILAACGAVAQGQSPTIGNQPVVSGVPLDADRYVGVLWVKETPRTRQMVQGLTGSQIFLPLYRAIVGESPIDGVGPGSDGEVPMTIRTARTIHWSGTGRVENGVLRLRVPAGTRIPSTASLCAVFPRALGERLRDPAIATSDEAGRMACLDDRVFDFFGLGCQGLPTCVRRGLRPNDGLAVLGFQRG